MTGSEFCHLETILISWHQLQKSTAMSDPIKIATIGDLQPGEGKVCLAGNREIALFNLNGVYYAIDNECPHNGGPLGEGQLNGDTVTCPWHGWKFNVCTGACSVIPNAKVNTFEVLVENNEIKVKL